MCNLEDYIINAFQTCDIIGLGEGGHGLENSHQVFREMFDNKKIQEIVDIVIVEFANTAYQQILDDFIFGKNIVWSELSIIWRESSQAGRLGELPIYFQLLNKIREINILHSNENKIRVLAGDPPINWKMINNFDDYKSQIGNKRDNFPAELAIEYGIKNRNKVLVIYSEIHLTKLVDHDVRPNSLSITSLVNENYPDAMKVIGSIYGEAFLSEIDLKNCHLPSIIDLSNSEYGNIAADKFFQASLFKDGKEIKLFDKFKIKELFDALLYVGPYNILKRCPMPEPNFDNEYLNELNRRREILGMKLL